MENLPVGFASFDDNSIIDRAAMTNAINKLAEIIWKKGGFRFWHGTRIWKDCTYKYSCSQDAERARKSVAEGQRDAPPMERFPCQSQLVFRPSFGDRTLPVILKHTYHTPYRDHQLSPASGIRSSVCCKLYRCRDIGICKQLSRHGGSI